MSEESPKKFRFSDIVRKLDEAAPARPAHGQAKSPSAPVPGNPPLRRPAETIPEAPRHAPSGLVQPDFAGEVRTPSRVAPPVTAAVPIAPPATAAPAPADAAGSSAALPLQPAGLSAGSITGEKEEDEGEGESFDIYRYLNVVIRRKYIILVAMGLLGLVSLHSYLTAGRYYISHSRLLFSPGDREIVTDAYSSWARVNDRERQLNTHVELLKSDREVLHRVAETLENRVTVSGLAGGLTVTRGETAGQRNDIIELKFLHADPDIARDVVNQVCTQYVNYIREVQVQDITQMIGKFQAQIDKVESELREKEDNLRLFKEKNQFVELSSEANALVTKASEMAASLQQTELDLQDNRERLMSIQGQIGKQEIDIVNSVTYQDLYKSRLSELEFDHSTLQAEYSTDHYKVQMVAKEIERIKEAIRTQATTKTVQSETFVKNPVRESLVQSLVTLTIDKASLEARRGAQEQISAGLREEMGKLPSLEQKSATLQRETESLLQTLQMLKTQYEKAKIKRDSQETDLKILQLSDTPRNGVREVKVNRVFMGLLVGLIIGIALAFLFEYLDQTIKEPRELERGLELPLLGIVPLIEGDSALLDFTSTKGRSRLEPLRVLRTNLKHLAAVHNLRTLIVCSAVKGEGKTTLAVNLAVAFAMDGKKIILVDGDLRRPQVHAVLGVSKDFGFSDFLTGAVDDVKQIIKPTKQENFSIITSGERPDNPTELLGTIRLDQMIQALIPLADLVIFDSPALLPVSDTITMAPKVDACVMVARMLWTPLKAARQAKSQLERIGSKLIGSIFNGLSHSRGYYPYYYGYYRYYAYKYTYDYDEEPRRKSPMREWGLKVESALRAALVDGSTSAPRFVGVLARDLRAALSKKRFWLLLAVFIITSALVPWIRDKRRHLQPPQIELISAQPQSRAEPPRPPLEQIQPESGLPTDSGDGSIEEEKAVSGQRSAVSRAQEGKAAISGNPDTGRAVSIPRSESNGQAPVTGGAPSPARNGELPGAAPQQDSAEASDSTHE